MSVEILEAESDFFRHYDAGLEKPRAASRSALGPDLEEAALPNIEEAVRRFLADSLVLEGHAKLRAQGVPDDVLPDESGRSRSLELDVLPELDTSGFEVCTRLREGEVGRSWNRDVPVIMVSARGDPVDRVRGFARGADDYVVNAL